jgi:hypothetical protein
MNKKLISLAVAGGLILGASNASAAEITIQDVGTGSFGTPLKNYNNSFSGDGGTSLGSGTLGGGIANEDNETEWGTQAGQAWDMESFYLIGNKLYIIGGYDMQAGAAGSGGSIISNKLTPGDLFIKVGGLTPDVAPTIGIPSVVQNGVDGGSVTQSTPNYGYTFAIDLSNVTSGNPAGAFGATASVYNLTSTSLLNTVVYDDRLANPWKVANGHAVGGTTSISYQTGKSSSYISSTFSGLTVAGTNHNVLEIDLSFMSVPVNTQVYFSYTMECGNDSLKGQYGGGFDQVPDQSTSVLLIGLGFSAMALFGIKRRKS